MIFRQTLMDKFIPLSVAAHLAIAGALLLFVPKEKTYIPIELSFGTSGISGGGDGRMQGAPKPQVKARVKPIVSVKNPDAPVVESKVEKVDEVNTSAAATAPAMGDGEGGTGLAKGDGVGSGSGGGNSTDPRALYGSRIGQLIQKNLQYPLSARKLGQQGVVMVNMTVGKDGQLLKAEIAKKSPYQAFNLSSLETIRRVGKFPPIPKEIGLDEYNFIIPVKYIREI